MGTREGKAPAAGGRRTTAPRKRAAPKKTRLSAKRKAAAVAAGLIGGRFTENDLKRIERAAHMGMTVDQISALFEMSDDTFEKLKTEEPRIARAYKKGQALGIEYVTGKLFAAIRKGNIAAIIFYLKTKGGFRERIGVDGEVKHSVSDELARVQATLPQEVRDAIGRLAPRDREELGAGLARPGLPEVPALAGLAH